MRPRAASRGGVCRAARSSSASTARAARRPTGTSCCTRSRTRRPSGRAWACRCRARSAGRSSATSVKRLLREAFARVEERPARRPGHRRRRAPVGAELAEREGLAGVDAALGELIAKAGLRAARLARSRRGGAARRTGADEHARERRGLDAAPAAARAARGRTAPIVPTSASSRRRFRGAASTSRRARATRSTRCGEYGILRGAGARGVAVAQVQPVELRRIRSRGGPASVQDPCRRRAAEPRSGGSAVGPQSSGTALEPTTRSPRPLDACHPRQRDRGRVLAADHAVRNDHGVHPRQPRGRQLGPGDRRPDRADPRRARAADVPAAEVDAGDAAARAADRRR